jgi:hypothetical protein
VAETDGSDITQGVGEGVPELEDVEGMRSIDKPEAEGVFTLSGF